MRHAYSLMLLPYFVLSNSEQKSSTPLSCKNERNSAFFFFENVRTGKENGLVDET